MSRRACLTALVLAVSTSLAASPSASAVYIAREGEQIVVRPDEDELFKDVEVTVSNHTFTIAKRYAVDDIGTPHAGPGCDTSGPHCPIGDAKRLVLDLGEGDQQALVIDSPIPVIVDGGTGRDRPEVRNAPQITIVGGTGNDIIKATGPDISVAGGDGDDTIEVSQGAVTGGEGEDTIRGATYADGGNGDDTLESTAKGARLIGGAGNDSFDTASPRTPGKQRLDCGEGSDIADIDGADVLGHGCGPRFTHLRKVGTLARFTHDGTIRLLDVAKVPKSVSARVSVGGPRLLGLPKSFDGTYASSAVRLAAGARVASRLKPANRIRSVLGKRRAAVTNATVRFALFAPGKNTGDRTLVTLPGTLRPL
jgi:hypothetical protein